MSDMELALALVGPDLVVDPVPVRSPELVLVRDVLPARAPAITPAAARPTWAPAMKRAIDLVLALLLIVVLLPLMVAVAVAVFAADPGPVLFRQRRIGRNGRTFAILKFRTMVVDAEERLRTDPELYRLYLANDHKLPPGLDPRVTRIGRLLRSTSLDELPQLFNVLAGSMSLVGPRPVVRSELALYGERASVVLSVRPGMTGLWQVSGRSRVGFPERADMDTDYASGWSVGTDVAILWRTVGAVTRRTGAC